MQCLQTLLLWLLLAATGIAVGITTSDPISTVEMGAITGPSVVTAVYTAAASTVSETLPSPTTPSAANERNPFSSGTIAGVACSAVVAGLLLVAAVLLCVKNKRKNKTPAALELNSLQRYRVANHNFTSPTIPLATEPIEVPGDRPASYIRYELDGDRPASYIRSEETPTRASRTFTPYTPSNYQPEAPDSVARTSNTQPPSLPQEYSTATLQTNPSYSYLTAEHAFAGGWTNDSPPRSPY